MKLSMTKRGCAMTLEWKQEAGHKGPFMLFKRIQTTSKENKNSN
jgi:hypothetical protein